MTFGATTRYLPPADLVSLPPVAILAGAEPPSISQEIIQE